MRKDSSKKLENFYDIYLEKLDNYLIKNEVKRIALNFSNSDNIDQAILPKTKEILEELKEGLKENLSEILKSFGYTEEIINVISKDKPDIMEIDTVFDRYLINKFKLIKVPYKCEEAKQAYLHYIMDISNIKNILRAKHLNYDKSICKSLFLGEGQELAEWKFNELADLEKPSQIISSLEGTSYFNVLKDAIEDYNKEQSIQVFEQVLDGLQLELVKNISLQNYLNLGPTVRFLVSKETEIRNLKIIAKGIGEKLSSNLIKSYLITEVGS
jgi:V/A-type H+-transporting ATPase subunit C